MAGFFRTKNARLSEQALQVIEDGPPPPTALEDFYADLMGRRPELLDEKLKLHERIIDEFNLAALEKLPPDELARQIRTYVGNYARAESLSSQSERARHFHHRDSRRR